ncbi:MAG: hypothetical protein MUE56_07180, partial [Ignavibacteria bacterium]|nr:hypothetical protein [Ignavibacteria bacterium]
SYELPFSSGKQVCSYELPFSSGKQVCSYELPFTLVNGKEIHSPFGTLVPDNNYIIKYKMLFYGAKALMRDVPHTRRLKPTAIHKSVSNADI